MTAIHTLVFELFIFCVLPCFIFGNKEPWNILPNNTGDFCPARDLCIWGHQQEPETNPARGRSCCTDCSCESTCGKEKTCCFPQLDTTNRTHGDHKSCLQTSEPEVSLKESHVYLHYLMVDSNPDAGCIVDVPEIPSGEQCGNVEVELGGTKYPAYSKLKKTIYKNNYCAQCHNATDAKLTQISLHGCPLKIIFDAMVSNSSMVDEIMKMRCSLSFDLSDADLQHEQCYVNVVDTCKSNFYIPDAIELTARDIEKACVSGLFSPYTSKRAVYSNVFCAICTDDYINVFTPCPLLLEGSPRALFNSQFTIILHHDVTCAIRASLTRPGKIYKTVCFSKENHVECRPLFCPKEMVFVDGLCTFMSKQLVDYPYVITLKLIPDKDVKIEIDYLLDELFKYNKEVNRRSSWSKKWKIFRLYAKDNTYASNKSTLVTELLVRMTYRSKYVNPMHLMETIQPNLKTTRFILTIGNTSFGFRQTLSEYYQLVVPIPSIIGYVSSKVHSISKIESITNQTVLNKVYKEDLYIDIPSVKFPFVDGRLGEITPTHLCDLIQLNKDEYVVHASSIVYYKLLDKYFIDGQFDMTTDEHGETVVKICFSESGFQVTNNEPSTSSRIDLTICLCLVWSLIIYEI